jgi:hypothetical protein
MEALVRQVLVTAIFFVPVGVVLWLSRRRLLARSSRKVAPFQELRRRPAGETIRVKLAEFDDKIGQWVAMLALVPILVGVSASLKPPTTWLGFSPWIAFSLIYTAFFGLRLHRMLCKREDYQLGFDGERFVGEELNRLIGHGYEVYHDVPFDGFNMDHVLVGPGGVFVVETKTRRKPVDKSKGKEFRVQFDGSCLRWPWGTDAHGLEQAVNNARTLSQWLGGAVGEPVYVTPILTLPGWMVDRTVARSKVQVLNPKEILRVVSGSKEHTLSEAMIKRICHQLDQKCRIEVE